MLIDRHSCGGGSNLVSAVTLLPAEQRRIESSTIRASCGQEGIGAGAVYAHHPRRIQHLTSAPDPASLDLQTPSFWAISSIA